jgi:hypothetical protein
VSHFIALRRRDDMDEELTPQTDVYVIGGGLGGLAAAALVARSGLRVTVFEQRGRLGGRATTDEREGFRFNQGPHALYLGGEGIGVLRMLGIDPAGSPPTTSGALMVRGGRTHLAPGGPLSLLRTRLLGTRDKADLTRILPRLGTVDSSSLADLSADQWIGRLTDRARVAEVLHAIVRLSTYVNAPHELSADVAALQVQRALGDGVRYLAGGWERLIDALAGAVLAAGGKIVTGDHRTGSHEPRGAAAVIVATGGPSTASTITGHDYGAGVPAMASVLDLSLSGTPAHRFVIGVDEPIYLSDHGSAQGMTPPGRSSLSLARYLVVGVEENETHRDGLRAFARYAGVTAEQVVDERYLHRMTTVTSIATAASGGLSGRPSVAVPDRPGMFVVGDWVGHRGHLADAVLASAEQAAAAAVMHVDHRTTVR